jgi:hypothetical protein
VNKPLLVVLFNETWCALPKTLPGTKASSPAPGSGAETPGCPIPYRLSRDPSDVRRANLLLFHIPTFDGVFPRTKPERQCWVAWSMESEANYPGLANPDFLSVFDFRMTYQRDADIWVPYVSPDLIPAFRSRPAAEFRKVPAVYIASNPHALSGRDAYVRELMRNLRVDSYGKCLHNRSLPGKDLGRESKLKIISSYRFTLAFENSVCADYVTEKFYDPLVAGSVPVYLGAPNVADFAPAKRSFLSVSDFVSPAALADHLRYLAEDENAYGTYTRWRSKPVSPAFAALVRPLRVPALGRLLHAYINRPKVIRRKAGAS